MLYFTSVVVLRAGVSVCTAFPVNFTNFVGLDLNQLRASIQSESQESRPISDDYLEW